MGVYTNSPKIGWLQTKRNRTKYNLKSLGDTKRHWFTHCVQSQNKNRNTQKQSDAVLAQTTYAIQQHHTNKSVGHTIDDGLFLEDTEWTLQHPPTDDTAYTLNVGGSQKQANPLQKVLFSLYTLSVSYMTTFPYFAAGSFRAIRQYITRHTTNTKLPAANT